MKKILIVDDSALMRRVLGDIIRSDERFVVADEARNGLEALALVKASEYDAIQTLLVIVLGIWGWLRVSINH